MKNGTGVKLIEVRDSGTTMPCMVTAICTNDAEHEPDRWLIHRGGWDKDQVGLYFASLCPENNEYAVGVAGYPYIHTWSRTQHSRTLKIAWEWVQAHWDEVSSGDVIDVQYIMGETTAPKLSDRLYGTPEYEAAYDQEA